ncbi:thioredoxin family protein [Candidatus Phytoplasma pini]|uniref:Thioredoxin n=1 Tax=Candidatus Phytoplasma pini TaxID=267362 RepID=A0A559KJN2_9MOLU|nr:thioredoxin family protein [Candidatus Phytoplasma pini]TVY12317.1 Thioredoxin [Candidatus Phytoplasma pini]
MLINEKKIDLENIINQKKKLLVDFFANWCPPCRKLISVLDEEMPKIKDIYLIKIDIDLHPDLATKYKIKSLPTLILFSEGEEKKRTTGYFSNQELLSFLGIK